ncbi:MAG: glycosyltransferase, partial [Actinomycetia bacterium]|nr:glycosyltransferase [Actinomycetes bacterium]
MVDRTITECVNGKWLAQAPSGTQRYASQVMESISRTPAAHNLLLVLPSDADEPPWAAHFPSVRSRCRGILFEQIALPWISRGKHLYSMAGPAPLAKRKQTVVMHDAMPFRFPRTFRPAFVLWYWLMYGLLSRTASRVLTVSTFSRSELAQILRVPESRFELAPCGSDHLEESPAEHDDLPLPFAPGTFALIVGNLAPHKNVEVAATALVDAGLPVAVVGVGQQVFRPTALTGASFALGSLTGGGNLQLLGRVDDARLCRLYAAAGVLVAPSRYEGFGIPLVEAGKFGCPAVFALGSAMEDVAGEGGLGFPADDMAECVSLVQKVISDQQLRRQLSENARVNADRFSWDGTAQAIFRQQTAGQDAADQAGQDEAGRDEAGRDEADQSEQQVPLRVLHVTETFAAGTGTAIIEYARAMQDQAVESFLLAQDRGSGLLGEVQENSPFAGAQIVEPGLMNLWRSLRAATAEVRPDVVHLHSSLAGALGRLQPPLPGRPVVVYSPHCFAFERRDVPRFRRGAYRFAEGVLARRTDAFICVSPHEAQLARSFAGVARVDYVLNAFGLGAIASMPTDWPETIRIVTVGRVALQKDPTLFLGILAALRSTGQVEATWVGDGSADARSRLDAAGVSVTGWIPAAKVHDAIVDHTVYLHTAAWEASVPIAVLDAMNSGLPVVVKRNLAYRGLLPEAWQFDDIASAVGMIRELSEPRMRRRRIQAQFNLLNELRNHSPDKV